MPLLALLPLLTKIPDLFDAGKQVYESVTGKAPVATTAETLISEVQSLPPDQQAAWSSAMQAKTEAYKAETERLKTEEGELTPEVLKTIGPEAAAKIAIIRMTTRPWAVRKMVYVLLLPFYTTLYDMGMTVIMNLSKIAGHPVTLSLLADSFFNEKSLYRELYELATTPAMAIVMSYMLLRAMEKSGKDPLGAISGAVQGVMGIFKRKTP